MIGRCHEQMVFGIYRHSYWQQYVRNIPDIIASGVELIDVVLIMARCIEVVVAVERNVIALRQSTLEQPQIATVWCKLLDETCLASDIEIAQAIERNVEW